MIVECPKCGAKNQTTQPPQSGKKYRCGKCGAEIPFLQPVDGQGEITQKEASTYDHLPYAHRVENRQSWTKILNSNGRCSRIEYALILIIGNAVAWTLYFFLDITLTHESWGLSVLLVLAAIAISCTMIIAGIRRLHDLNYSGWYFLLILIPFVNLGLTLGLLFMPGKKEGNRWQ